MREYDSEVMTNAEISAAFTMIGKILDLMGENPFRVRAYERAAMTISSLPRELSDIYVEGGMKALREIAGIGEDLGNKIEEMVTTGELKYLDEMKKKIPEGLFAVMQIEGMGPKKTKMVWEKLKVKNVADLEAAAKAGKLAKLPKWGELSEKKVLQGIATRKSMGDRVPLSAALPLAEQLVAKLKATKLCGQVAIAGSMRRRSETIGDIDILATSTKPAKVMEAFCGLPEVKRVLSQGPTKSSVNLHAGIQCDLRVVEEDVFGAALHYFTGSKAHNVHLRTMGVKAGITISEYGVHKGSAEKKGKLLASKTESDVYASLKLPYIAPELREDRGEIDAARAGTLPKLIEEKDIKGDLHLHTDFSDGGADAITMAKAAYAKGLEYIAITDHGSGMGMVRGLKENNLAQYLKMIEKARKAVPQLKILSGVEVDIQPDGSLYLSDKILRELDWVVAAVHSQFKQSSEETTARLLRAIENPYVRAMAHPTGRLIGQRPGIEFSVEQVFTAAKKRGVAMEINASPPRQDLRDIHCKRAKEMGVMLTMGSDAHAPEELDMRFGIMQARRGWIEKGDVMNTKSWSSFEKWLRSH